MNPKRTGWLLSLLFVGAVGVLVTGCDTFSNLTVNCQVGVKNDNNPIAGCEFRNTGKAVTNGCINVHVVRNPTDDKTKKDLPAEFVSETLCSGDVQPGKTTDPLKLRFERFESRVVAEACVETKDGGKPEFKCEFKIEEVAR
ncbi:MAG: hypothetical protein AUK47_19795 [Deltaproteobacteria bacterium CG2_30_63_29]|nr:MAG: hypothetical protein AUK47_19795 [Deltaproteobacteria bacterium CG2_30_63_29]PJB47319.1 MAG: hypothetical protein CO108_04335 [Deltaproteobacteria bacterium CG_4_9_14_3_um_filter_63_12]